jgi:hypothetical protein
MRTAVGSGLVASVLLTGEAELVAPMPDLWNCDVTASDR